MSIVFWGISSGPESGRETKAVMIIWGGSNYNMMICRVTGLMQSHVRSWPCHETFVTFRLLRREESVLEKAMIYGFPTEQSTSWVDASNSIKLNMTVEVLASWVSSVPSDKSCSLFWLRILYPRSVPDEMSLRKRSFRQLRSCSWALGSSGSAATYFGYGFLWHD